MYATVNVMLIFIVIPSSLHSLPISSQTSSCTTVPPPSLSSSHTRLLEHSRIVPAAGPLHLLFSMLERSSSRNPHGSPFLFPCLCSTVTLSESPAVITMVMLQHFQSIRLGVGQGWWRELGDNRRTHQRKGVEGWPKVDSESITVEKFHWLDKTSQIT